MALLDLIIQALWFILPAYLANASPVIFAKLAKGKYPIDCGLKWSDGRPILGAGKTWPGLLGGIFVGALVGGIQGAILVGFLLALGALLGDMTKSFFKRRLRMDRGESWPFVDQWDFLIGALLLVSIVQIPSLAIVVVLFVITPLIHLGGNSLAYLLKLKKVWY